MAERSQRARRSLARESPRWLSAAPKPPSTGPHARSRPRGPRPLRDSRLPTRASTAASSAKSRTAPRTRGSSSIILIRARRVRSPSGSIVPTTMPPSDKTVARRTADKAFRVNERPSYSISKNRKRALGFTASGQKSSVSFEDEGAQKALPVHSVFEAGGGHRPPFPPGRKPHLAQGLPAVIQDVEVPGQKAFRNSFEHYPLLA